MQEPIVNNFHACFDRKIRAETAKINKNIADRTNGNEFEISLDFTNNIKQAVNKIRQVPEYYFAINALFVIEMSAKPVLDKIKIDLNTLIKQALENKIEYSIIKYANSNGVVKLRIVRQRKD